MCVCVCGYACMHIHVYYVYYVYHLPLFAHRPGILLHDHRDAGGRRIAAANRHDGDERGARPRQLGGAQGMLGPRGEDDLFGRSPATCYRRICTLFIYVCVLCVSHR